MRLLDAARPRSEEIAGLARSKSTLWFEGYKAGCMQFLQTYIPDSRDGTPLVIGVAGGSGSGKTTIKDVIVEQLGTVRPLSPPPPSTAVRRARLPAAARDAGREAQENVAVPPHDNYYRHRSATPPAGSLFFVRRNAAARPEAAAI